MGYEHVRHHISVTPVLAQSLAVGLAAARKADGPFRTGGFESR